MLLKVPLIHTLPIRNSVVQPLQNRTSYSNFIELSLLYITLKVNSKPTLNEFVTFGTDSDRLHTGTAKAKVTARDQNVTGSPLTANDALRNSVVIRTTKAVHVRARDFNHTIFSETIVPVDNKETFPCTTNERRHTMKDLWRMLDHRTHGAFQHMENIVDKIDKTPPHILRRII
jgi:hypothetical protein